MANEVGVSDRTLRRAINDGTIHAARPSARKLNLPLRERTYLRSHWRVLGALREALRTEPNVRLALLFGSIAAGEDTPTSDVDILVDLRDDSLQRVIDLATKLSGRLGRRVDLVRLRDADFDAPFLADVLKNARVLLDRDRAWPHLDRRRHRLQAQQQARSALRTGSALDAIDRLLGA